MVCVFIANPNPDAGNNHCSGGGSCSSMLDLWLLCAALWDPEALCSHAYIKPWLIQQPCQCRLARLVVSVPLLEGFTPPVSPSSDAAQSDRAAQHHFLYIMAVAWRGGGHVSASWAGITWRHIGVQMCPWHLLRSPFKIDYLVKPNLWISTITN